MSSPGDRLLFALSFWGESGWSSFKAAFDTMCGSAPAASRLDEDIRYRRFQGLTTLQADEDILRSYDLHANCYITKPVDLEQFFNVIRTLEEFWLTVVKLPAGMQYGR